MPTMDLTNDPRTYAVVGATGQQGGAVVAALISRGQGVRALVRDPESDRAKALADQGVELVRADLTDPDSLQTAFTGVDGVFAMTTPREGGPEAETEAGLAIVDAAQAAGVPHLLFSSVGGAERETGIPHFESKRRVEEHLQSLPLRSTIVRPVFFMDNLTQFMTPREEDGVLVLRAPLAPEVPLQMVAVSDIGTVAAALLINPDAAPGGELEIAGDDLTPEQIAATFGAQAGLPARFEPVPTDGMDEDSKAMFDWFTRVPAYQADFGRTRELDPAVLDFAAFLATGPGGS